MGRQADEDRRALAELAHDGERAAVQFDELLGERQVEAAAFEAPAQVLLDLPERLERARNLLRAHADPGVGDFDREPVVGP
jgi:hypothetical protein